jgi:hypothetical protein
MTRGLGNFSLDQKTSQRSFTMGRPKLPSKVKVIKGSFRPCRENPAEPPATPLGSAPAHLNDSQKGIWDELVKAIVPGVLAQSDRMILEIASVLLAEFRENGTLSVGNMSHLISVLARLGMSPADRSKVSLPDPKTKKNDAWKAF